MLCRCKTMPAIRQKLRFAYDHELQVSLIRVLTRVCTKCRLQVGNTAYILPLYLHMVTVSLFSNRPLPGMLVVPFSMSHYCPACVGSRSLDRDRWIEIVGSKSMLVVPVSMSRI